MKAEDIPGPHPDWRNYLNGPADHEALMTVRGIGPARADLLLRLYGFLDGFLMAAPAKVAEETHGLIGASTAAVLQKRCIDEGLKTTWSGVEAANRALAENGRASNGVAHALLRARTTLRMFSSMR